MLIDSHCHLDDEKFAADLEAVLERAPPPASPACWPSAPATVRPNSSAPSASPTATRTSTPPSACTRTTRRSATAETSPDLRRWPQHPKVVAFGEIGLDYHYDFSPREIQREVFDPATATRRQRRETRSSSTPAKPGTTPSRSCASSWQRQRHHALFHRRRTGTGARSLDLGFHLSFRRRADVSKSRARPRSRPHHPGRPPADRNRCPYLAPVPYRGKRNEPAFMIETAARLAEVRGSPVGPDRPGHHAPISNACVCRARPLTSKLVNLHELRQAGPGLSAREIFDLVHEDLERVEKTHHRESVASVEP